MLSAFDLALQSQNSAIVPASLTTTEVSAGMEVAKRAPGDDPLRLNCDDSTELRVAGGRQTWLYQAKSETSKKSEKSWKFGNPLTEPNVHVAPSKEVSLVCGSPGELPSKSLEQKPHNQAVSEDRRNFDEKSKKRENSPKAGNPLTEPSLKPIPVPWRSAGERNSWSPGRDDRCGRPAGSWWSLKTGNPPVEPKGNR